MCQSGLKTLAKWHSKNPNSGHGPSWAFWRVSWAMKHLDLGLEHSHFTGSRNEIKIILAALHSLCFSLSPEYWRRKFSNLGMLTSSQLQGSGLLEAPFLILLHFPTFNPPGGEEGVGPPSSPPIAPLPCTHPVVSLSWWEEDQHVLSSSGRLVHNVESIPKTLNHECVFMCVAPLGVCMRVYLCFCYNGHWTLCNVCFAVVICPVSYYQLQNSSKRNGFASTVVSTSSWGRIITLSSKWKTWNEKLFFLPQHSVRMMIRRWWLDIMDSMDPWIGFGD